MLLNTDACIDKCGKYPELYKAYNCSNILTARLQVIGVSNYLLFADGLHVKLLDIKMN